MEGVKREPKAALAGVYSGAIETAIEINMDQENVWLEPQEVADYLGISLSHVYRYMRQTPPPWSFYRVTNTKRLSKKSDLDAWLEKVKVSA